MLILKTFPFQIKHKISYTSYIYTYFSSSNNNLLKMGLIQVNVPCHKKVFFSLGKICFYYACLSFPFL